MGVMRDCVFCRRVNSKQFDDIDTWTVSFTPLSPVVPGHKLFVSRDHLEDASVDPFATGKVFETASMYAFYKMQPFNLITSAGPEATQTIKHLHIHYVPRAAGDGLHLPWTGQHD